MQWIDIPTVLTLAGLEIVLSADNAIVLGAMAHRLPAELQKRALFYGLIGAFILRFLAILSAKWIIQFWFLQIAGGAYLVWLGLDHLTHPRPQAGEGEATETGTASWGFWRVVLAIELTDLAFAVDSVLAAVGMSRKLPVIYLGAVIGLVAMRFAATGVLKLLGKFPSLITYAYILVTWIGLKLIFQGCHQQKWGETLDLSPLEFWIVLGLIMFTAVVHCFRTPRCKP